jgi:hypothetical protein
LQEQAQRSNEDTEQYCRCPCDPERAVVNVLHHLVLSLNDLSFLFKDVFRDKCCLSVSDELLRVRAAGHTA